MKRFVFTLQRLYEVKAREEERKRKQLKELGKELEILIKTLNEYQDSFDKQKREYKEKCAKGINKDDLKNFGDYFSYLNDQIMQQNTLILDCENRIAVCRQELWKLMNEQKVLDRMREEQLQEYNSEVQKEIDKEIEDFMQSRM